MVIIADIAKWVSIIAITTDNWYFNDSNDHRAASLFLSNDCIMLVTTLYLLYAWHYIDARSISQSMSKETNVTLSTLIGMVSIILHTIGVVYWFKSYDYWQYVLYQIGVLYTTLLWFLFFLRQNYVLYYKYCVDFVSLNDNHNSSLMNDDNRNYNNSFDVVDALSNDSLCVGGIIVLLQCLFFIIAFFYDVVEWEIRVVLMFIGSILIIVAVFTAVVVTFRQSLYKNKINVNWLSHVNKIVALLVICGLIMEVAAYEAMTNQYNYSVDGYDVLWVAPVSLWFGCFVIIFNVLNNS